MDSKNGNYRGTRNGFRLINNYLVDSGMFEIVSLRFFWFGLY